MLWWRLLACAPPALDVVVADGPHRHRVPVTVRTDAAHIAWATDGVERGVLEPGEGVLDVAGLAHGVHTLVFSARTTLSRTATVEVPVTLDHEGPAVLLGAVSRRVEQGHTLPVFLSADEPAELRLVFLDRERPLYPVEGGQRALVGVPIRTEPGPHPLVVEAVDALGNRSRWTASVEVEPVDWPFTGKLPLSKKKAEVAQPDVERMRAERDPVYAEDLPEARWDGPATLPVEGTHTSAFGTYREYPDGRRSHHDAEDIARKPGVPVLAAMPGTVRLARMQAVHGNAVLLAHGQGVVSLYSHLQALGVEEGREVARGDTLGLLGSTGRSTGPHLHWGIVVDEVPVDPMQWLTTDFHDAGGYAPMEAAP